MNHVAGRKIPAPRALLAAFGQVGTDRIATELGVSRETVRRDLKEMEDAILRRIHGGIVPAQGERGPHPERTHLNLREARHR